MHSQFASSFCDPVTGNPLHLYEFESSGPNLLNGIFFDEQSGSCYPLMSGVPVFLTHAFPKSWLDSFSEKIGQFNSVLPAAIIRSDNASLSWSFSSEWDAHRENEMTTTWGYTPEERYQQFLLEVEMSQQDCHSKTILDAGCGNGLLTEFFAKQGMKSFGIDFSNSVFAAEARRKNDNVCFLRGDLQHPPFAPGAFDVVVSNGVIHHTPDTKKTFNELSKVVRSEGRFYIWLYQRKGSPGWKLKRRVFDLLRVVVSRTPQSFQKLFVSVLTRIIYSIYKLAGKQLDYQTLHVDMFDSVTPRWRHYHSPGEVSKWYYENGYGAVRLTHWNNRYGFGVYAVKKPLGRTPGENWEKGEGFLSEGAGEGRRS